MAKFIKSHKSVETVETVQTNKSAETSETPTASKEKKPRQAIIRELHPSLIGKNGERLKLTEWPSNWSYIYHKALTVEDFESEVVYLRAKANWYEKQAKEFRQEAEDIENGKRETNKQAKKVKSLLDQLPELLKSTAGIDLTAIMSSLQALQAAQTAQAPQAPQS